MGNFSVFLNDRIVNNNSYSSADLPVACGNFCLLPVRCLFKGHKVTIFTTNTPTGTALNVRHETESKRTFLRVIASILFLVPGLLLGCIFKGIGYLSPSIRENHKLSMQRPMPNPSENTPDAHPAADPRPRTAQYTPINVGSNEERLGLEGIEKALTDLRELQRGAVTPNALVIYAQPGTEFNTDPGFLYLKLDKVILVGARIIHDSCAGRRLDDALATSDRNWESSFTREGSPTYFRYLTFVKQHPMASVDAALADVPPNIRGTSERYKRIYLV